MAFDLDKYIEKRKSESFDLDAYIDKAKKSQIIEKEGSSGKAFLESAQNEVLMGHLPQVQAGITKALGNPTSKVDDELRAKGFSVPDQPSYVEERDANIKALEQQKKDYPKASIGGQIAGIAGGGFVGAGLLKGVGLAKQLPTFGGRIAQGVGGGAILGGLQNPGDVEGEISPIQLKKRSQGAAIGGIAGGAAQGLIEGVSKAGKGLADYFKAKAGEKAVGAIGANKVQMKRLGKEGAEDLGKEALDAGIVGPFSTPAGIAKKAAEKKEVVGEQIGNLIKSADEKGATKIDGTKLGLDLLEDPEIIAAKTTPGSESMAANAEKYAETLARKGDLTIQEAHNLRRDIDKNINFNRKRMDLKPGESEVLYKIRDSINNEMNSAVDAMGEGAGTNALKKANSQYSKLSRIQDIAENRIAMNSSNRTFGLTDTIAATAGMASGGVPYAALGAAANKFGRTFGKGIQASGFKNASKVAQVAANKADVVSPAKVQSIADIIAQKLAGRPSFSHGEVNSILKDDGLMDKFKSDPSLIEKHVEDPLLRVQIRKKIGVGRGPSSDDSAMKRKLSK